MVARYCRFVFTANYGETVAIERPAEMMIEWEENTYCWIGTSETVFPRFEAWRSDESVDDPWCLNMVRSSNAKPIRVCHLQSLDAAREFAEGLLAEFDYVPDGNLPVTGGGDAEQTLMSRVAGIQPQPQVAASLFFPAGDSA